HRITTRQPLRIEQRGDRDWAVYGSPADCVRIAMKHLFSNVEFDWVMSGVNQGGNLGVDIYYSGTVAAVREATLFGVRSIAFSHYIKRGLPIDWGEASDRAREVISILTAKPMGEGTFWNVNLPHLESTTVEPALKFCEPCKHPLPVVFTGDHSLAHYAGRYPDRLRREGSDTDLCFGGDITISNIKV
ncbi:MAG: 5'/3'-nucleotidase SurE, partial [Verrucomicrobia bacterium]|nr:5'/3'-nucleotidase SurE [Verrucomicrobiota bacterium]